LAGTADLIERDDEQDEEDEEDEEDEDEAKSKEKRSERAINRCEGERIALLSQLVEMPVSSKRKRVCLSEGRFNEAKKTEDFNNGESCNLLERKE
jgi:hypothetical protein